MDEKEHAWISNLEVGQPIKILDIDDINQFDTVSRITLNKIYLHGGRQFSKEQTPGTFPRLAPFTFAVGNPVKEERKRKVLCQRLKRFDWGILDKNQALRIYRYVNEIKEEKENEQS